MELENSSLVSNVPHIVFVEWGNKLRIKKKKSRPRLNAENSGGNNSQKSTQNRTDVLDKTFSKGKTPHFELY